MKTGETVQVVKGPHVGKQAEIRGSEGYFYHIQLLTPTGRKTADGLVSVHRSAIAPAREGVQSG